MCYVVGSLSLLIDYASVAHDTHQISALLILRNLCFHAANKPKLLTHGEQKNMSSVLSSFKSVDYWRFTVTVATSD